jgi:two-component system chemotaxis response regulator CheB
MPTLPARSRPITVLVVDDSAFMRHAIATRLLDAPDIVVLDTARDGVEALTKIRTLRPDIVTLDVEMPTLDGLGTLRRIMHEVPSRVLMLSSRTNQGAIATIEALRLGALDFVAKPNGSLALDHAQVRDEVQTKVRRLADVPLPHPRPMLGSGPLRPPVERPAPSGPAADAVLVIGASTGGPKALCEVVPRLPTDRAAVLVVQHMPAGFTQPLAARLDGLGGPRVQEAQTGNELMQGVGLLAPGDHHLMVGKDRRVLLTQAPRLHGVRPALDLTLQAVARRYGPRVVAVVLTGMGVDGRAGALAVKEAGGKVIAEDESTAAIWGMPRAVVEAGAADRIVPLGRIAEEAATLLRDLS